MQQQCYILSAYYYMPAIYHVHSSGTFPGTFPLYQYSIVELNTRCIVISSGHYCDTLHNHIYYQPQPLTI